MPVLWRAPRTGRAHLSSRERVQALTDGAASGAARLQALADDPIEVVGRLADASNLAMLVRVGGVAAGGGSGLAIYKPVSGERPLWDFPDGTLAAREVAAYAISAAGGWDVVPETVLRDGPRGPGSVQRWVGDPAIEPEYVVDVVTPEAVPDGWLPVLRGEGARGEPVVVVHEDSDLTRAVAALDAVLNNSDRKGSHLVREGALLRGFDNGLSLHEEDKLRTVFWGFAGQPLGEVEVRRITAVHDLVADGTSALRVQLDQLITPAEVSALLVRCRRLLERGTYPRPTGDWPAIPWPPL